jgi:hypothetical protein
VAKEFSQVFAFQRFTAKSVAKTRLDWISFGSIWTSFGIHWMLFGFDWISFGIVWMSLDERTIVLSRITQSVKRNEQRTRNRIYVFISKTPFLPVSGVH